MRNIKAREVIVAESAKGNVETIDRLVLRARANFDGDVKTPRIVIEEGACFKDGIETVRPRSSWPAIPRGRKRSPLRGRAQSEPSAEG